MRTHLLCTRDDACSEAVPDDAGSCQTYDDARVPHCGDLAKTWRPSMIYLPTGGGERGGEGRYLCDTHVHAEMDMSRTRRPINQR